MSNRSKRTVVVANAEPAFVQSCLTKWSKGLQRGAKWDKVRARVKLSSGRQHTCCYDCSASFSAALFTRACVFALLEPSGAVQVESPRTLVFLRRGGESILHSLHRSQVGLALAAAGHARELWVLWVADFVSHQDLTHAEGFKAATICVGVRNAARYVPLVITAVGSLG